MFNNVKTHLLTDSGLDLSSLEKALGEIYHHDNDYADLYFQSSQHESWVLEDGIIKDGSYNIERGVGVRAVSGEKTGFAYSDDINETALLDACRAARTIAPTGGKHHVQSLETGSYISRYKDNNPLLAMQGAGPAGNLGDARNQLCIEWTEDWVGWGISDWERLHLIT